MTTVLFVCLGLSLERWGDVPAVSEDFKTGERAARIADGVLQALDAALRPA